MGTQVTQHIVEYQDFQDTLDLVVSVDILPIAELVDIAVIVHTLEYQVSLDIVV